MPRKRRTCVKYGLLDIADACGYSMRTMTRRGLSKNKVKEWSLKELVLFIINNSNKEKEISNFLSPPP